MPTVADHYPDNGLGAASGRGETVSLGFWSILTLLPAVPIAPHPVLALLEPEPQACFSGWVLSAGNWNVCACKRKHQNVWGVF